MKKFLLGCAAVVFTAGASFATALPARAPSPLYKATPAYSWSGFYAGVHGGYGWGENNITDSAAGAGSTFALKPSGGFGGVQIGYNSHFAPNWLIGGEIDSSWGDISDSRLDPTVPTTGRSKFDYFGSARTRFGYVQDRSLLYVTGGVAWAHDKFVNNVPGVVTDASHYLVGWTLGAGWEYAFDPRWSMKIEYLYTSFSDSNDNNNGGNNRTFDTNISTVRAGLNYRFGDTKTSTAYVPMKAPVSRNVWEGGYFGVHGGYGSADYHGVTNGPTNIDLSPDGGFGGFQSGANWQFAPNWVFGLETDGSYGSLKDNGAIGAGPTQVKIDGLGTARARLGYAYDSWLVYGTAGGAYAREKSSIGASNSKEDHFGWAAGGGVEWKFAPDWSAKIEYIYADLGKNTFNDPATAVPRSTELKVDTVKFGINYYGPIIERLFTR
jgi:opacity protein-like surface antigen